MKDLLNDEEQIKINRQVITFTVKSEKEDITKIINNSNFESYNKKKLMAQAFSLHLQKKISEAEKYYKLFIDKGYNDPRVLTNYGVILKQKGEIEKAIELYRKSISLFPKSADAYSNLGIIFKDLGQLKDAKFFTLQAIKLAPNSAISHYSLGNILKKLGKLKEAEISTRKAIKIEPSLSIAHCNLGNILKDLGKLEDAKKSTEKAIEINPIFPEAYSNLGVILKDLGKLQEAEKTTKKAIKLNPEFAEAHSNLGNIFKGLGRLKDAEIEQNKAIKINPKLAIAHCNLGNIFKDLGKLKEAEISTRKAIKINPLFAIAHCNLGNILYDLGKLKEAEISTRKAIKLNPKLANAYLNLGLILRDIGKTKEAIISSQRAIQINPQSAEAYLNLGDIFCDLGKLEEAEIAIRQSIKLNPNSADAYFNLSIIELLQGNYESGLAHYEFRDKRKSPANLHAKPVIEKIIDLQLNKEEKLLIVSEQGLGDTLQYMRYIPHMRNQGFDISFCAQTKLHSLIKESNIDKNPLTPSQANKVSEGKWIPLLSLAKYLRVCPKNKITAEPYIRSKDELVNKWKLILSKEEKPIIGINWQGNPQLEKTYKGRSIPLEVFSILSQSGKYKLLSLQKGFGSDQIKNCSFKDKFVQCQSKIDSTWDFLENAAIVENCDLIISCDTSIAHLAGGMGKKVWLLLRDVPFWTWGLKGENTFWYESMTLFRQEQRHDWINVMERVSDRIKAEV